MLHPTGWFVVVAICATTVTEDAYGQAGSVAIWDQWRGPTRDGLVPGSNWPTSLSDQVLTQQWRVELDASYSGPIVSESTVFVTGTAGKKTEVVTALDRKSGKEL